MKECPEVTERIYKNLNEILFEQMNITLEYLYRVGNMFIAGDNDEAMYHLGRLTSELKTFIKYEEPVLKEEEKKE